MIDRRLLAALALGAALISGKEAWPAGTEVAVPAGSYVPFFVLRERPGKENGEKDPARPPVPVAAFRMDAYPVTQSEYLVFVRANPGWRKSAAKRVFVDRRYLEDWRSDLAPPAGTGKAPVTYVSWFAAQAYCEWKGRSLPTTDQWEYAAADGGQGTERAKERILAWYSRPNPRRHPPVGSGSRNRLGIHDLFGLVWEWTLDFNGLIQGEEARGRGAQDTNQFCGGGSQGALDPADYASFMRYSFRNSLKANFTVANLGFRCVKESL